MGVDAFAWPTHHYGRWGLNAGAWFWIPATRWAPAYVSWGYAPGYVSWCPLGWNNRAVIGVDVFRVGPGYYSSAHAWTLVLYSHFGGNYYVHQRRGGLAAVRSGRPPASRSAPLGAGVPQRRQPAMRRRSCAPARGRRPMVCAPVQRRRPLTCGDRRDGARVNRERVAAPASVRGRGEWCALHQPRQRNRPVAHGAPDCPTGTPRRPPKW